MIRRAWLRRCDRSSGGFDLDERIRTAITATPEHAWESALDATGAARDEAQVTEVTGLLRHSAGGDRLETWPGGMRIIVRREEIETGTQLSLFEQLNGYRYQPLATATSSGQLQRLEARHRVHARVEGFIRCGKATGLAKWPSALVRDQHRLMRTSESTRSGRLATGSDRWDEHLTPPGLSSPESRSCPRRYAGRRDR